MTALECYRAAVAAGPDFQRPINAFVDGFRAAPPEARGELVRAPIEAGTKLAGLIAAVISALSREQGLAVPEWVGETGSPEPFFVIPAKSFALRVRLMFESPPAFRCRNVFVPENYLSRA